MAADLMRVAGLLALILSLASLRAQAFDDPDTEIARRHFEAGRGFYDAQDYRRALEEFTAAKRARAAPALDYNIARCHDRLENYPAAIRHYEIYLGSHPADASEVSDRIGVLKQRIAEIEAAREAARPPPPASPSVQEEKRLRPPTFEQKIPAAAPDAVVLAAPPRTPDHRRRNLAIVLGVVGVAVIAGAVALGVVLGGQAPSYTSSTYGPMKATP